MANFKRTWSFWGGRKRLNHNFDDSFNDEDRSRKGLLGDHPNDGNWSRNTFQTRSLRLEPNRIAIPHNVHRAPSIYTHVENRDNRHKQWSDRLQRECGYQNVDSPYRILTRSEERPHQTREYSNQHGPDNNVCMPQYVNLPSGSQAMEESFHQDLDEPIYENLEPSHSLKPSLPCPNFRENRDKMGHQAMHPHISPHNIRRPPLLPLPNRINPFWESVQDNVCAIGPNAEETFNKGNRKLNKAIQGICTSVRSLSQKFKKTTKRQYKLEDSPCTPKAAHEAGHRVTPGKLVPFDVTTPVTPHSFRKGPKRLHSARRLSRENLAFLRSPGRGQTRGNQNWTQFHSPVRNSPVHRFRQY